MMRISELAARTGSTPHALRHYESLGLIAATRTRGNYREFDDAVVREVVFITMGRRIGFSLAEIARWLPAYRSGRLTPQQMIDALRERIATIDATLKLVAPARGQRLIARGRVVHAAGLLTVCAAEVCADDGGRETLCATLLGTARNLDTATTAAAARTHDQAGTASN